VFRQLFSFSKKEIDQIFSHAELRKKQHGFKLLQVSFDTLPEELQKVLVSGKLLVITPRSSGKAHDRNLLRRRAKEIFYSEKLYLKPVISILIVSRFVSKISFDTLKEFLLKNI